jgi:hypothetical protein
MSSLLLQLVGIFFPPVVMASWKEFSTMNILGLEISHLCHDVLVRDTRDKKDSFVLAA